MMTNFKIKKTLFTLSIIAAIFFTLGIIGKKFVLPFPSRLEFSNITSADIVDGKKSLIADKQGEELVFLNEEKEINNIVNLGDGDKLSRVKDIARGEDCFYVFGDKRFRNSVHIEYERVVKYTLDGRKPIVIYESKKDNKSYVNSIKDINVVGDTLYVTKIENVDNKENALTKVYNIDLSSADLQAVEIVSEKTPYAFDAKYLHSDNSIYTTDYFGHLSRVKNGDIEYLDYAKQKVAHPFLPIDNDTCIWLDFSDEKIYVNDKVALENIITVYLNASNDKLIYENQYNQSINIYDYHKNENVEYKYIDFSKTYFILTLARFVSVIYLIVLVLYLLFNNIFNKYKEKDYDFLKKFGLIFIAVVVIIFVSIYYENRHIESNVKLMRNEAKIMASFFADTIEKDDLDDIDIEKKETFLSENVIEKAKYDDYYGLWANLHNDYNQFVYVVIYKKYNDKDIILYDSTGLTPYNTVMEENGGHHLKHMDDDVKVFSFGSIKNYYLLEEIKNKLGEKIGAVEIGLDYNILHKQTITECFEMSMSLLTIFVAIYLMIVEGFALVKGFIERKKNADINKSCQEIYFTHSLLFFQSLVRSFDTVILVLITKDMVSALNYPIEYQNYLITIPTLCMGVGSIVGPILYVFIAKRLDVRKSLITNSIIIVFVYAVITYAVHIKSFIIFCAAMLVLSIANIIVYTGISVIPYRSDVEEERYVANHEKSIGKVSASIFGALVGGVVVHYFGNVSLYIVNTIACVPIVILLFLVLPKNTYYIKKEKDAKIEVTTKRYLKYIFSVPMISFIIFVLGPVMVAGGYRTYVFPLFTAAMNMPKMYITNFYVFARVIMMILSNPIVKVTKKIDYWDLTIYCIIAIGLSFMTFGINTTVVWAIIMLVINSIIDKVALPTKAMLWPRHAEACGLDVAETQTLMTLLEKVAFSFKEVIFAALLAFGDSKGCVIFGVISLVFALLFAIVTKNSTMAKNNKIEEKS